MANRERQIRIYDLHSWTGVALGLLLFVVCFTGSLALFHDELKVWEDPAKRTPVAEDIFPIHDRMTQWIEQHRDGREIVFAGVFLPEGDSGFVDTSVTFRDEDGEFDNHHQHWDTSSAAALPIREDGANRFLYDLHPDLAWPEVLGGRQVGRFIVGLVGIAFLLSIVTGIVAHTKIKKELFSLRYLKSVRLKWQDSHKVLGLWTTPFAGMIAITGAFLGVIALLLPLLAFLTVKGDQEKLINELGLGAGEPAGISAPMQSVDGYFARTHPDTGKAVTSIFINHYGDQNAVYTLNYKADDRLVFFDQELFSGVDGSRIENKDVFQSDNALPRILAAFSPLHYGTYGGIVLKLIYFALGLGLAIMTALGSMMWIERRRHGGEGTKTDRFYGVLSFITTGVCAGLPVASIAVLHFDKFYAGSETNRYASMVWAFFAIWITTLAFAAIRGNDYKATREMLGFTGVALIALAPVNWVVTGGTMWSTLGTPAEGSGWFDIAFILVGVATIASALRLPSERPSDTRRSQSQQLPDPDMGLQPAE